MGCSVLNLLFLCLIFFWLFCHSSHKVDSQTGNVDVVQGSVFVNGTAAASSTDDDFICATLDWWPPDQCDYGTCSWGSASLLNLVRNLNNY